MYIVELSWDEAPPLPSTQTLSGLKVICMHLQVLQNMHAREKGSIVGAI